MTAFITSIVAAIGSLTTGLFATSTVGESTTGVGILTCTALALPIALKVARRGKAAVK